MSRIIRIVTIGLAIFIVASHRDSPPRVQSPVAPAVAGGLSNAPSVYRSAEDAVTGSGAGTPDIHEHWHRAEASHHCELILRLMDAGEWTQEADDCKAKGLPVGDWRAEQAAAIAAKDPLALLSMALNSQNPAQIEAAKLVAARSHDPETQVRLGFVTLADAPVDGFAWLLIGCPDCTLEDPRLGFALCVDTGSCPSNTRLVDWIAAEHGQAFAQAVQARAETLVETYR